MVTTPRWSIVFVLGALFAVVRVARLERQPGWSGLVIAIVVAGAVVVVMAATSGWRDGAAWFGVVAVALAVIGSGLTRRRGAHEAGQGAGDVVARLDIWPAVVAAALIGGLVALAFARARPPVVPLATLAIGTIVVTFLARDVVTGHWIAAR
jgi:hypothetical protein